MTEELKKIDRIIIRYLLNEADKAEKEYLLGWLKVDINNRNHFFAFKNTWEKSQKNISELVKTSESMELLKEQIQKNSNVNALVTGKSFFLKSFKYAAAILLLVAFGFAGVLIYRANQPETQIQITEIATNKGQKKEITLPDGTRVWLNSGTTFKYADDYGKMNREVYLLGEAFFEVTRDESKTFIVRADDITIKVLGTSFNVNCYPDNKVVETTVISGIVSIENPGNTEGSDIVILNKLEKGTYVKEQQRMLIESNSPSAPVKPLTLKKLSVSEEETGYIASWKDQSLSFNNETFEEIAVKLERWYNVSIRIDNESLKSYRYKGKFDNVRSIFQVLEVVKLTTPINYEYNEKTKEIIIKESKKN